MAKAKDLTGGRFGRLAILERVENDKCGNLRWLARCDCGETTTVLGGNLTTGRTQSCGCLNLERCTTHGLSKSRVYAVWSAMVQRCTNPRHKEWGNYGERGISVCQLWMTFDGFYADMGDQPKNATIDRIDNDGNYCPNNCRWATQADQARNKRTNVRVSWRGRSRIIGDVADEFGINRGTVYSRLGRGWSPEEALTTPLGQRRRAG